MRLCLTILLFLSLMFASIARSGAANLQSDPPTVMPGKLLEREIAAGETHLYQITLPAQQYVFARVEQFTIDVKVRILRPDGQMLAEFHHPGGTSDAETVMFIAETAGAYRFEIIPAAQDAARGKYGVHIKESRLATPSDELRIRAEKLYLDGMWGFKGDVADRPRVLEMLRQAAALWHELNDPQGEGRAFHMLGLATGFTGNRRQGREYLHQALSLASAANDRLRQVEILAMLVNFSRDDGDLQQAQESASQAIVLARGMADPQPEIRARVQQGWLHIALHENQRALDQFEAARLLGKRVTDPEITHSYTYGLCNIYHRLGDDEQALGFCLQALKVGEGCNCRKNVTLREIGTLLYDRGEFAQAAKYLNESLSTTESFALVDNEADVLEKLGILHLRLHEPEKALARLKRMLTLAEQTGGKLRQATALMLIGQAYLEVGDSDQAFSHFEQAAALNRALGVPEIDTLLGLARLDLLRGRKDEAQTRAVAALEMIETRRSMIVSPALRATWFAGAQNVHRFYLDLLMQLHREQASAGNAEKAFSLNERSRARSLLDSLGEARANIREGVEPELLARERDLQQRINEHAQNMTGKNSAQLAKEKQQLETLLNDYQVLQSQIRARSPRYTALTQPQPLSLPEVQQQVLDEDTLLFEYTLGEPRSYLWIVSHSDWHVYELPPRAEIEAAATRLYDLLKAGNKIELRGQGKLAAAKLSDLILRPAAGQLGNKRLLLVADGALQYIPFGALPEPLSSAPQSRQEAQPLLVKHELVYSPSASLLALLRREFAGRAPASRAVLALADPVLSEDDLRLRTPKNTGKTGDNAPQRSAIELTRSTRETDLKLERLKFTRVEAEYIAGLARRQEGLALLDFSANKKRLFNSGLDQYRILHFATHGLLNSRHPELSGLVLSLVDEAGTPQDGFLRLHDVYNLKLNADLVVLSACQTALGKEIKGEGLLGLTRGFMYAGTPRVVASLWDVRDEATSELMKRFYQHLLKDKLRPAEALRAAQLSLLRDARWAAPYFWAGFVLQGEWR